MQRTTILIIFFSCLCLPSFAATWEVVGEPGISNADCYDISLKFNKDTPYLACAWSGYGFSGKESIQVWKYDTKSGLWEKVGEKSVTNDLTSDPTAFTEDLSSDTTAHDITLDFYNEMPCVGYNDSKIRNKPVVIKYNKEINAWKLLGRQGLLAKDWNWTDEPGRPACPADYSTSLSINDGAPFVAYEDHDNFEEVTVVKYDENNDEWKYVGAPGIFKGLSCTISLYVYNGTPYVVFSNGSNKMKAVVMRYAPEANQWELLGDPDFRVSDNWYETLDYFPISLCVYDNVPYVAYMDYDHSGKLTVKKYNEKDNKWVLLGKPGISKGKADGISLCIDNGVPYISYWESPHLANLENNWDKSIYDKVMVVKYNARTNKWETLGGSAVSATWNAGAYIDTSIYVYDGIPYVAYTDMNNSAEVTVMRYK